MVYLSLYRKWRSQGFDDLMGQEPITVTLKNAIQGNRISQAYLFCGPRGTGKTSLARIFAKAINCREVRNGEPCNRCPSCRSITEGNSMDVIEIDAASHTQVEKVREFIINKVDFLPVEGKYKVYIIDEVHKFSNSSFNALLKTLEEPPRHVLFILATTHPQDLPPTILSRCQRFDFRRIPGRFIEERLRFVSEQEQFVITQEAISILAEAADGSMRDALVLLEQVASLSGAEITMADAISLLGLTDEATLTKMDEIILGRQSLDGLRFVRQILEQGKDLERLAEDIIGYYRRLLLLKVSDEASEILPLSEEKMIQMKSRADSYEAGEILRILKTFLDLKESLRDSSQRRLLWEMAVIRLTRWQEDPSLEGVRRGLLDLDRKFQELQEAYPENGEATPAQKRPPSPPKAEKSIPQGELEASPDLKGIWSRVLAAVKKEKMALYSILGEARLQESPAGSLVLGFPYKFHIDAAEKEKALIERKAAEAASSRVSVVFKLLEKPETQPGDPPPPEEGKRHRDFVGEVQSLFGGGKIIG